MADITFSHFIQRKRYVKLQYDHCFLYKDVEFKYTIYEKYIDLHLFKNGRDYYIPLFKKGFWNEYVDIVAKIDRLELARSNYIPYEIEERFPRYTGSRYHGDEYRHPYISKFWVNNKEEWVLIFPRKESYPEIAKTGKIPESLREKILVVLQLALEIDREIGIMLELMYLKGYRLVTKKKNDTISTVRMIVLGIKIARLFMGQSDGDSGGISDGGLGDGGLGDGNLSDNFGIESSLADGGDIYLAPPADINPLPLDNIFLGNDYSFDNITNFESNNRSEIDPLIGYSPNSSDDRLSFTGSTDLEYAKSYHDTAQRYADEAEKHLKNMEEAANNGDSSQFDLEKKWANEAKEQAKMFDSFAKRREEWSKI